MGAWAEGVFDNDAAGDWADELARTSNYSMVRQALTTVAQAPGIDESCEALVAVEVVAALRGWPLRGLPAGLKDWLDHSDIRPSQEVQRMALAAITIIRERSDLADEFGSNNRTWLAALQKLSDRLSHAPKPRTVKVRAKRSVPRDEAAAIKRLDLNNNSIQLTPGGRVKSLHLCDHDDATLAACLPWLTMAKRIYIARGAKNWATNSNEPIPTTDAALTSLDQFSKLEELILSGTLITDATLARIAGLTKLNRLLLACTPITDAGLAHLSGLVNLEELDLGDQGRGRSRLTSSGLACLRGMTKLRTLNLQGTAADDSVLASLSPMQSLGELYLHRTKVTGAGLVHLSKLLSLWFLELESLPIGDEHVVHLARLTNLQQLGLSGRRITEKSLDTICQLKSLQGLSLVKASITDEGLRKIALLPKLEFVCLKGTDVTTEGARWLRQARPGLDVQGRNR